MERTGHQSLDGVRSYKGTSLSQRNTTSNILNGTEQASIAKSNPSGVPRVNTSDGLADITSMVNVNNTGTIAHTSNLLTNNVIHTPPAFNFHSCSVTINYVNQPQH